MTTPDFDTEVADAVLGSRSFADFCQMAWPQVVPGVELIWGYEQGAVAEHLEAVTRGQIQHLIINIPPRHAKSTLTGVLWPAWEWIQAPYQRFLNASYDLDLSTRDSVACRRLVQSPWYQRRWGLERPPVPELLKQPAVAVAADENLKTHFATTAGGLRFATSVGAGVLGFGGNRLTIDDPIDPRGAVSDAKREAALDWYNSTWLNRRDDPNIASMVVIMQRLHPRDLSGYLLERDPEKIVHVNLPLEYEPKCVVEAKHSCSLSEEGTTIGFKDWRKTPGEPLNPKRMDAEQIKSMKNQIPSWAYAGPFQQRPTSKGGHLVERGKIRKIQTMPTDILATCRAWDLAGTDEDEVSADDPAWTVGLLLVRTRTLWIVAHVARFRKDTFATREAVLKVAQHDGRRIRIRLPQDPGQAGKSQARDLVNMLSGWRVRAVRPTGDKVTRAQGWIAQAIGGNLAVLDRPWTETLLDELHEFPRSRYKDQADALSDAFDELSDGGGGFVMNGMSFGGTKRR